MDNILPMMQMNVCKICAWMLFDSFNRNMLHNKHVYTMMLTLLRDLKFADFADLDLRHCSRNEIPMT